MKIYFSSILYSILLFFAPIKGIIFLVALSTILDTNKTLGGFRFTKIKHEKLFPTTKWDKHKKPIIQYDLEGNLIREWSSAKEAAETLGIKIQNITACCRGESKTAYKSIWKNA